jgi:endonuclease/exonuclease/phosphatase family metal-dependent hydrolase
MGINLKISTYNIQHGTNTEQIVKNIITLVKSGVNLICLQEVRHHPNKPFIVDTLLNKLGTNWKAEYLISSKTFDLGLCTIWDSNKLTGTNFEHILLPKLPKIRLYEKVYLKIHRKLEKVDNKNINPETKAALIGEFEVDGKNIRITNTHLDWLGGHRQRTSQLEFIKEKLSRGKPCVYEITCGDFNTLGYYKLSEQEIKKQIKVFLNENFSSVFKNSATTTFWQTLDHILVKNLKVVTTDILKLKGSDHYPLLVEVKI